MAPSISTHLQLIDPAFDFGSNGVGAVEKLPAAGDVCVGVRTEIWTAATISGALPLRIKRFPAPNAITGEVRSVCTGLGMSFLHMPPAEFATDSRPEISQTGGGEGRR